MRIVERTCAVCGKTSSHRIIVSTTLEQYFDLDFRPTSLQRSLFYLKNARIPRLLKSRMNRKFKIKSRPASGKCFSMEVMSTISTSSCIKTAKCAHAMRTCQNTHTRKTADGNGGLNGDMVV